MPSFPQDSTLSHGNVDFPLKLVKPVFKRVLLELIRPEIISYFDMENVDRGGLTAHLMAYVYPCLRKISRTTDSGY